MFFNYVCFTIMTEDSMIIKSLQLSLLKDSRYTYINVFRQSPNHKSIFSLLVLVPIKCNEFAELIAMTCTKVSSASLHR